MDYSTIYLPTGKVSHASRDGIHPLCDSTKEGTLVPSDFPAADYVGCHRCTRRLSATAKWSGNKQES